MADAAPKVLQQSRRKVGVLLPPSDIRATAPLIIIGSLTLILAGWADLGLFWLPPHLGNTDWEIGTVSQTIDAMPLGTIGMLLLLLGVRSAGGRRIWPRLIAIVFLLWAVFLGACLAIFALDLPYILDAMRLPDGGGIKRGAAKVFLFGAAYTLAYLLLGIMTWRSTSRREAAEVAAKRKASESAAV